MFFCRTFNNFFGIVYYSDIEIWKFIISQTAVRLLSRKIVSLFQSVLHKSLVVYILFKTWYYPTFYIYIHIHIQKYIRIYVCLYTCIFCSPITNIFPYIFFNLLYHFNFYVQVFNSLEINLGFSHCLSPCKLIFFKAIY